MDNHFKHYKTLLTRINNMNMELIVLKDKWYNLTGTTYDDIKIKGTKPVDIADQLHNIVEKEDRLKAVINQKEELRRIHENEINKIKSNKKRTILKLFYLDGCSIKQIAHCLEVSDGHVKKLKRYAIQEFKEKVIEV